MTSWATGNMSQALVLTLGHNSSAILVEDGKVVCGYEQERLSGVKSDSAFPVDAIIEIRKHHKIHQDTNTYVGHWFLDHKLPAKNKYWDPDFIKDITPFGEVLSLDREFSHHDSHLEAAMVFAQGLSGKYTAMILDGFGSSAECISIYEVTGSNYRLIRRWFGFEKSLGLLYQYATAFLGMKMHNHEYKMLAYEVHIHGLSHLDMTLLTELIEKESNRRFVELMKDGVSLTCDPMVNLSALPNTQAAIDKLLFSVLDEMGATEAPIHDKRCIISYFVQHVVENVVLRLAELHDIHDLLLCGGLFYNVKLNSMLANTVSGTTCIMPLAGDQGAGLGVYQRYCGDLVWPDNLFWGKRDLSDVTGAGLFSANSLNQAQGFIWRCLDEYGFVNIVRGAMEFGPRALCNTTTLAIPAGLAGGEINFINNRTNEMPFALVCTESQAENLFVDCGRIYKSLDYMICTREFKAGMHRMLEGGAHYYPDMGVYTCRPQITRDPELVAILEEFGPLINTSFNYHGVPIVLTREQILYTHEMQLSRGNAKGIEVNTLIIKGQ